MRIWGHVVEPRPRLNDGSAGRGWISTREAFAPVRDELLVDLLALGPARRRLVHRQAERVAAPPEVEPRLGLEDHRQVVRNPRDRAHVDELAAKRADRKAGPELRRERTGCDHENLPVELARISAFANFDPPLRRPPDELPRHLGGLGDPVLPAGDRPEHVVRAQALDSGGIDALDGNAEATLELRSALERREPLLGRREEQVADLVEERPPELLEEADRRAGQPHLCLGRELLPHAAHCLPRRSGGDLGAIGEHDVVRSAQRQLVGDARADRAGTGYDDSSHSASSVFSSGSNVLSGRRTSSRKGTPSRPRQNLAAA